jgi:hypothetical protein
MFRGTQLTLLEMHQAVVGCQGTGKLPNPSTARLSCLNPLQARHIAFSVEPSIGRHFCIYTMGKSREGGRNSGEGAHRFLDIRYGYQV